MIKARPFPGVVPAPRVTRLHRPSTVQVLLLLLGALAAYLVIPVFVVLIETSLRETTATGELGRFTAANYTALVEGGQILTPLWNSFLFSLGSSVLAIVVGTMLAWIVERTNTPLRKLGYISAAVSFAVPYILYVIAWLLLLGRSGPVNSSLMKLFSLDAAPVNVLSVGGMVFLEGILWSPLVFLMLSASFRSFDPALEEAASMSGSGVWHQLRYVSLPLVRPALASVLLLVVIRSFESFEVPALVGLPGNVQVVATRIYLTAAHFPPDYGQSSAFSVVLVVLVAAALFFHGRVSRGAARFQTITGKGFRPRILDLGAWRWFTCAILLAYFGIVLVVPLLMVLWISFMPFNAPVSPDSAKLATLGNYVHALAYPKLSTATIDSVVVGIGTATLLMLCTSVASWVVVRGDVRGRGLLEQLFALPLVFPGIVLGLALIQTYLTLPIHIYNTLWILLVAFATRYLPYGMRYAHTGMVQIHRDLDDAAMTSGASPWQVFRRVILPLLSPAFWSGWLFIFLLSLKELSMSVLLAGPRTPVVSVAMFQLWNDGQVTDVAAFGVLWTVVMALLAIVPFLASRKYGIQMGS